MAKHLNSNTEISILFSSQYQSHSSYTLFLTLDFTGLGGREMYISPASMLNTLFCKVNLCCCFAVIAYEV